jgi:hypothetical protein
MTPSTLCIADVSISRAITLELERLRPCGSHVELTIMPAEAFARSQCHCQEAGDRYFTHIRQIAPANSSVRPGTWVTNQTGNIGYTR